MCGLEEEVTPRAGNRNAEDNACPLSFGLCKARNLRDGQR